MRYAAFPLTLLLALAVWAAVPADRSGEPHLSVRYLQNSAAETGIASPVKAVAGDYRSFDPFLLPFLFLAAGILLLSGRDRPLAAFASRAGLLLVLGGVFLAGFIGWGGMSDYANLLDHGFLTRWFPPEKARGEGAFLLGVSALLGLAGLVSILGGDRGSKEGARGK